MKVYLALNYIEQPCTLLELEYYTGLSKYKVGECLKLLSKENIIHKERVFICDKLKEEIKCIGTEIDINAFGIKHELS